MWLQCELLLSVQLAINQCWYRQWLGACSANIALGLIQQSHKMMFAYLQQASSIVQVWHHNNTESVQLIGPWKFGLKLKGNFQANFIAWWLTNFLWNCHQMNVIASCWWQINIGLGNGLVPSCYYLSQCCPITKSPYGFIRSEWVNSAILIEFVVHTAVSKSLHPTLINQHMVFNYLFGSIMYILHSLFNSEVCKGLLNSDLLVCHSSMTEQILFYHTDGITMRLMVIYKGLRTICNWLICYCPLPCINW